jgi:hypothetical protein
MAGVDFDVAVIVPSYRSDRGHLDACCEAVEVAVQHAPGATFQLLLVDDGCPLGTARDVAHARSGWTYLNQENAGLSAARNLGILRARATYLHFLDDDDSVDPHFYHHLLSAVKKAPDTALCYGNWRYFTDDAERLHRAPAPDVLRTWLISGNCFPVNAVVVSAALVKRLGGFDTGLRAMEDWDMWLRCIRASAIACQVPDAVAEVRIQAHSMSTAQPHMHGWMCVVCERESAHLTEWQGLGADIDRFAAAWGLYALRSDRKREAFLVWWKWGAHRWGWRWWSRAIPVVLRAWVQKNRSPHATLSADGEHRDRELPMQ